MKALKSKSVVCENGLREAAVLFEEGIIKDIISPSTLPSDCEVEDLGSLVLMPGIVDSHVHINEPGRTEWEGYETATQAAAAGGITTVVDMPLNCIPVTTTKAALEEKLRAIKGKLWVDCGFYGGVIPGNKNEILPLIQAGVKGLKAFLVDSGIKEFPHTSEADLRKVMPLFAQAKIPLLVHAELECPTPPYEDPKSYSAFLKSRPAEWENKAIQMMIKLSREFKCHVHIVHLSSAEALKDLKEARDEGLPITVETCPHYLTFAAEEIPDGDGRYKCAPPIREKSNREELWAGLKDGVIDFIVSDHSPCTPRLKHLEDHNLKQAWGGISGLQFSLPIVWTEAKERGFSLTQVSNWLSKGPAQMLGINNKKGSLSKGFDADFVVWDPDAKITVNSSMIHHRHKATPYDGRNFCGEVKQTYLRGQKVFDGGTLNKKALGETLL